MASIRKCAFQNDICLTTSCVTYKLQWHGGSDRAASEKAHFHRSFSEHNIMPLAKNNNLGAGVMFNWKWPVGRIMVCRFGTINILFKERMRTCMGIVQVRTGHIYNILHTQ